MQPQRYGEGVVSQSKIREEKMGQILLRIRPEQEPTFAELQEARERLAMLNPALIHRVLEIISKEEK